MILFVQEIDKQSNLLNITITIPLSSLYYTTVATIVELVVLKRLMLEHLKRSKCVLKGKPTV